MALTTIEQGLSFVQYEADGTTPNFPIIFDYLSQSDVKVFVGNTEVTYTWLNAATVTPDVLPENGDIVTVRRFTTNTERLVDFTDGGQLSERDLDKDSNQLFFLTQEAADTTNFNLTTDPLLQVVDFKGNRGINLAAPVNPTDAINKQYIDALESSVASAVNTANNASAAALAIADVADEALDAADAAVIEVQSHITDEEAHEASSIINTPAGNLTAVNVQLALNELDTIKQSVSQKGAADGYASLDSNGKVPSGQLPSFVDDVLEFANLASFPVEGETGKIYVAIDTSKAYRWGGTVYTEISPSEVNSVNGQTGTVVLDKTDIGLDQVDNTSDSTKNSATANLTNKSLISPNRLDAKKDTLSNLIDYADTTGINGELVYSTDSKEFFVITDGQLVAAGGSGASDGNLIPNSNFEGFDLSHISCTNGSIAAVAAGLGFNNVSSEKMGRITVTDASGYCDFQGLGSEGQGLASIKMKTALTDVEVCALVDGVEQQCIPASATLIQTWKIPAILGSTSNSVRVKWGASTSGTIDVDDPTTKIVGLESVGYSNYVVIPMSGSGNFTGGSIIVSRSDNVVTIAVNENLTHASSVGPNSATGALPEWARPSSSKGSTYSSGASNASFWFFVQADGAFGMRYYSGGTAISRTSTTTDATISYPVAPEKASAVNATMVSSDLHVFNLSAQDISGTDQLLTFDTTLSLANGVFASNVFTVQASGHYELEYWAKVTIGPETMSNVVTSSTEFKVNGVNVGKHCESTLFRSASSVTTAANSVRYGNIYCKSKLYLKKGDTVSARGNRENEAVGVNHSYRNFSITRAMNPNGESFIGLVTQDVPYDGTEVIDNEKVDGQQVYKRCYNLASSITTSGTTIETLPTGLDPIQAMQYTAGFYTILSSGNGNNASNNNHSYVVYNQSTGALGCFLVGASSCQAGTRFCMRYLK